MDPIRESSTFSYADFLSYRLRAVARIHSKSFSITDMLCVERASATVRLFFLASLSVCEKVLNVEIRPHNRPTALFSTVLN